MEHKYQMRIIFFFILCISLSESVLAQNSKRTISYNKLYHLAGKSDLTEIKKMVSNGFDINKKYKHNKSLLHIACYNQNYDLVKYLVENRVDLNVLITSTKSTPLQISTSDFYRNDSISMYLINHGAYLDNIGTFGSTALRSTIYTPKPDVFKLLLEKGVNINYECKECCGRTAFLNCCSWGTGEMLRLLLAKGVSIDQTDCKGLNGLMYAILDDNIETIKVLLENHIDVSYRDKKNKTAYDYAIKKGNVEVLVLLLPYRPN